MGDRAYMQLREGLLAGRFESGQTLTLRSLTDSFGTSITPVRDAVSRLVAQGVLEQGPRNTALVPDITVAGLRDLCLLRCELEGLAARKAAAHAGPIQIAKLTQTLEHMRSLITSGDMSEYLDAHRSFHFQIYRMAGIPVLVEMIENLWLRCGPVLSFVVPDYVRSLKGTDRHIAAIEALRSGDPGKAEKEVAADIEEACAYLTSLADEKGRIRSV